MIDKPTTGSLLIGNNTINFNDNTNNDKIRSKKIGIIYQQNNLLPDFTALENVYLAGLALSNDKKEFNSKSKENDQRNGSFISRASLPIRIIWWRNAKNCNG